MIRIAKKNSVASDSDHPRVATKVAVLKGMVEGGLGGFGPRYGVKVEAKGLEAMGPIQVFEEYTISNMTVNGRTRRI